MKHIENSVLLDIDGEKLKRVFGRPEIEEGESAQDFSKRMESMMEPVTPSRLLELVLENWQTVKSDENGRPVYATIEEVEEVSEALVNVRKQHANSAGVLDIETSMWNKAKGLLWERLVEGFSLNSATVMRQIEKRIQEGAVDAGTGKKIKAKSG